MAYYTQSPAAGREGAGGRPPALVDLHPRGVDPAAGGCPRDRRVLDPGPECPGSSIAWLAAAALAVLGLLVLLAAWIRRHATEIVVTDRRVIYKRGILSRHTVEMNVSKIETVDVEQGLWARMMGYGTVLIRGTGSGIEPLRGVGHPLTIRNAIVAG